MQTPSISQQKPYAVWCPAGCLRLPCLVFSLNIPTGCFCLFHLVTVLGIGWQALLMLGQGSMLLFWGALLSCLTSCIPHTALGSEEQLPLSGSRQGQLGVMPAQ